MFLLVLVAGIFAAAAMGYLGVFVIFKRVALAGDALSHVALPGIALALALGVDVLWGAIPVLLLAAVAIYFISQSAHLYEDAIIGILFSLSLAVGVLFINLQDLEAALFGDILHLGILEIAFTVSLSIAILLSVRVLHRSLALSSFSTDLARANGVQVEKTNFLFFILLALAVALGVKVVGTLLVGSLVIIPASAASNIARSLKSLVAFSILFAALSTVLGLLAAHSFRVLPGPMIVIFEGIVFLLTLAAKLAR
jgi:ABC-type Mn2+/Zn2+ transport system permease subunit